MAMPNTAQLALPPDAAGNVGGLPSRARNKPMSWRSWAFTCRLSVRSSVTGSPARQVVTPLFTVTFAISTSFAVQVRIEMPRSAAQLVTGNGWAEIGSEMSTPIAIAAAFDKRQPASRAMPRGFSVELRLHDISGS